MTIFFLFLTEKNPYKYPYGSDVNVTIYVPCWDDLQENELQHPSKRWQANVKRVKGLNDVAQQSQNKPRANLAFKASISWPLRLQTSSKRKTQQGSFQVSGWLGCTPTPMQTQIIISIDIHCLFFNTGSS